MREIHRQKISKYKKYKVDLKTVKFLNEFNENYEDGLVSLISDYIIIIELKKIKKSEFMVVLKKIFNHNNYNDWRV